MGKIVTTGQEMWGLAAYSKTTNEVLDAHVYATEYPSYIVSVSPSVLNYIGRD